MTQGSIQSFFPLFNLTLQSGTNDLSILILHFLTFINHVKNPHAELDSTSCKVCTNKNVARLGECRLCYTPTKKDVSMSNLP